MSSFRPKPHPPLSPLRKSRQKKQNDEFSQTNSNNIHSKKDDVAQIGNNLLPEVDELVKELYYPKTTYERLLFHRNVKRKVGRIKTDMQLDHFNNQSLETESISQKSREKCLVGSRICESSFIYESTITQSELDSMSIAESILMSEINRNILEIILECMLPSAEKTQSGSTQDLPPTTLSGSAEALKEEEMNRLKQSEENRPFSFSCVPSTIQSIKQELHTKIQKELLDLTKSEPKRSTKLTDNISQKVKAMEERARVSRLVQIDNLPEQIQPLQQQRHKENSKEILDTNRDNTPRSNIVVPSEDVSCIKAEEPKIRRKVAVIEEMTEYEAERLMSWQKEVVLPIAFGVSLGMVLDILEQNVVIVGFREVAPGVMGAAEASKRIDIGDMLLAINGHSLLSMKFQDIVDLLRSLSATSRHRKVVLLLGISEYIHAELNKDKALGDQEEQEDPFMFLDGVGGDAKHNELDSESLSNLSAVVEADASYCSFPGDLGLNVDTVELERRFQIMLQEGRRLRGIRSKGIGHGFYDNHKGISPLFSSTSLKIISSENDIKFKHRDDGLESSVKEELTVQAGGNDECKQSNYSSEVFSGGVDDLGTPWGLPPDTMEHIRKTEEKWKPAPRNNSRDVFVDEKKNRIIKESDISDLKDSNINIEHKATSNEPIGKLVHEMVELGETLSELELQLQHYTSLRGRQVVIPDELNALFVGLNSEHVEVDGEDDDSSLLHRSVSESEVGHVLNMILKAMSSIDLSERWCNPLDAWPPRRLTLTVASYVGFHIRDSVNSASFLNIESTLNLFLILVRNHWLVEAEISPINQPNPFHERISPSLRSATTLKEPKDILHRNLICDLTTLYFQIRSVGWRKLSFLDPSKKSIFKSKGYFWDLEVNYNTSFNDIENDIKLGVLWGEDRAIEFVNKHGDFLRINECISCAGAREWTLVTAQLMDLALSNESSEGRNCRDASHLVGRILNRYRVEDQMLSRQNNCVEVIDRGQYVKTTSGGIDIIENEGRDLSIEPLCENSQWEPFFKPKNDETYDLLPISHEDTLQLLDTLFKHCVNMEGYSVLLLEVGQLIWKFDPPFASRIFSQAFPHVNPWHVLSILKRTRGPLSFTERDIGLKVLVWRNKVNKYLPGSIVGLGVGPGMFSVKFDQGGLVEELDMTKECFEVFGMSVLSEELWEREVGDLQSLEEHKSWWYPKILYHFYLSALLGVAPYHSKEDYMSNKVACNNDDIVHEFIELSLLLASDVNVQFDQDRLNNKKDKLTESMRIVRHCAFSEGLDQSDDNSSDTASSTSNMDLLRYTQSLGRTAKEERLRNSIIYAKKVPFFGPFRQGKDNTPTEVENALDFDAWLFRIVSHSDYDYPKDSAFAQSLTDRTSTSLEKGGWMSYLKQRWTEHDGKSRATFRCTDDLQCHIDSSKLERLLDKFSIMSDDDSSSSSYQSSIQSTIFNIVNYRSAWPCKTVRDRGIGNTLQKAWNNVLRLAPSLPDPVFLPLECLSAVYRITRKKGNETNLKFQLCNALLCQRYRYWDGVLNICELILNDENVPLFDESLHLGIWLYELIRLALLGTCEVEMDSLNRDMMTIRILKSFFLVFKLGERFSFACSISNDDVGSGDHMFANRMPYVPRGEIGNTEEHTPAKLKQSENLLLGVVIDTINIYHAHQRSDQYTSNSLPSFYNAIIKNLIEVLGVLSAVEMVENLKSFINVDVSFGDRLLRCAFDFEVEQQERTRAAHRNLSIYHAAVYTNVTKNKPLEQNMCDTRWGCVLGEFDVCPLCSLALTDSVKGMRPLQVSAFRCGHMFHSACLQQDECFICQVESQSGSLM